MNGGRKNKSDVFFFFEWDIIVQLLITELLEKDEKKMNF